MVHCPVLYEFAQQCTGLGSPTAREDDILPYIGWENVFTKLQFVNLAGAAFIKNSLSVLEKFIFEP